MYGSIMRARIKSGRRADYERQRELFDGDPEWIDVEYGDYVGRPLGG